MISVSTYLLVLENREFLNASPTDAYKQVLSGNMGRGDRSVAIYGYDYGLDI